jgi:ADP-heptose:LPS heptosyltransferase
VKILLAKRRAMGDTVLLSSTVELLKNSVPGAEISVVVPVAFAPLLENHPSIKNIWSTEEGWLSLLPRIRAERFDHFFQLHASASQRWLGLLSGAKARHFHQQNAQTEKAYGKHPHALEWDAFHLRSELPSLAFGQAPAPRIYLKEEELAAGKSFWRRHGVDPAKVVFLGLGASRQPKRWPHFARFAELLRDRMEAVPAIVVGPGDEEVEFAARVINEMRVKGMRPALGAGKGDFLHLAGIGVRELAQALSAVKAYVGNDSGPKHIAAAVGIPTFTLFGPEDPVEWHPYDREQHPVFFIPGLSCRQEDSGRWCGRAICTADFPERHRCLSDIDPLEVYASLEKKFQ